MASMNTNEIDEFSLLFLSLALEINKHLEGYVDSYYGPEFIKSDVDLQQKLSPEKLIQVHEQLIENIPSNDLQRQLYLIAITNAMGCTIEKLNGKKFEYLDEVNRLFGISPDLVDEEEFLAAQSELEENIPGNESWSQRIRKREGEFLIQSEDLPRAVEMIISEIRNRSYELLDYDPREIVECRFVKNKPWGMDCHYVGNFRSIIYINSDRKWDPLKLTSSLIHETYPGHHTEFQNKERCIYEEMKYYEQSCSLLLTPAAVMIEGIARTAINIISPEMQIFEWISEFLLSELGLPSRNPGELYHLEKFRSSLFNARNNAAILFHSSQIGKEEAIKYIVDYGLCDQQTAEHIFSMVVDPLYSTYVFTYTEGYRIIDRAAAGENKLPLFKELISKQLLPNDILIAT